MKIVNKITVITLIAIILVIGVGFAAWTFATTADSSISNISGSAHAAIEADGLVIKTADGSATVSTLYVICDSPNAEGIYWSTTNDATASSNKITQVKLIGSVNEDDMDILDFEHYIGTFTCSFAGFTSGTWINVPAIALDQDVTSVSKNANVEYIFTLPTLSYKVVPADVDDVAALQVEVNALDLTITFSFNVDSVE